MKLSSRSQYAITAMLELALHDNHSPVTLFDISRQQKISLSYLEQLFSSLRQHKLVRGRRGPGGGYVLARSPDEIAIADIIAAVDGDKIMAQQPDNTDGVSSEKLWHDLSAQIYDYLRGIKLSQFASMNAPEDSGAGSQDQTENSLTQSWKNEVTYRSRA
jgi:Rrf2 family iron-sulfur cluster assembly transcriptional regulator